MAFKLSLVADVRAFLKGTTDVEAALSDVADSLDDLADSTSTDADKAADDLERKFTGAFDKVKSEARTAGKSIGDDVDGGVRKASAGTDQFKENAASNAKEVAARFDGSAESIADGFQGLAAEALEGFGPAGVAAGVAVAAGMGLVSAALQQADEDAQESKEHILDLGKSLATAESRAQGLADATADALGEMTRNPQNVIDQAFGKDAVDRLTLYSDVIRNAGLSYSDVLSAMQGDEQAYERVSRAAWERSDAAHEQSTISFIDDLDKQRQAAQDAQRWADEYANSQVAAAQQVAEAQQHARDVAADWADSLASHLDVAASGLDEFVKDGRLNLRKWAEEVQSRAKDVATIEDFKVDVFPKLSPEAQEAFAKLPTETQAQIAQEYAKRGAKGKEKIQTTLEAQVTVDPTVSQTKVDPVQIPTTVDNAQAARQAAAAAGAAQREADRPANVIEFATRIDRDELQRQVDRAAAAIAPPTITVKTKVQKEVP